MLAESDDLGADAEFGSGGSHQAEVIETDIRALGLNDEPCDACHSTDPLDRGDMPHLRAKHLDHRLYCLVDGHSVRQMPGCVLAPPIWCSGERP